ncbi:helix-turn-helix transcriptional regulator [Sphingomonas sp. RT2P30]|uniref:helix-turn-helix domain-containing protein n=1 Tax=Parasphingomonas halimpatiens TaxID=3096162 RepID=UPI002FC5BC97
MAGGVHDERYQALIDGLRRARIAANISQTDLAARLGRRQQFISKFESGERRLDAIEFYDIAKQLGVAWDDLIRRVCVP